MGREIWSLKTCNIKSRNFQPSATRKCNTEYRVLLHVVTQVMFLIHSMILLKRSSVLIISSHFCLFSRSCLLLAPYSCPPCPPTRHSCSFYFQRALRGSRGAGGSVRCCVPQLVYFLLAEFVVQRCHKTSLAAMRGLFILQYVPYLTK